MNSNNEIYKYNKFLKKYNISTISAFKINFNKNNYYFTFIINIFKFINSKFNNKYLNIKIFINIKDNKV